MEIGSISGVVHLMFQNENTFGRLKASGKEDEFHASYEKAVDEARKNFGKTYQMIIGGKEVSSPDGTFADRSPSNTDLLLGYFQKGNRSHAKQAIESAKNAFESWSETPYHERVKVYRKAADLASQEKFRLGAIMTFENGKNRFEAIGDVDEAIDFMRYYSEQLDVNKGFEVEMGHVAPNEHTKSILKPYGVWCVISPFNFPMAITTGMSVGASITGNTVVLKPASDTPLLAHELFRIMEKAGIPTGVFNYVTGPGSTLGAELIENPDVSGVVFTGSYDVGSKSLIEFERRMPRPFVAEMGGKNATIVTNSADLEKATEGVLRGAFGYGGQKCSACSRVYVHESVKGQFVNRLVESASKLKVDDPALKESSLGPVINESAYNNFQKYVEQSSGAGKIVLGGKQIKVGAFAKGYFVEPTIIVDLPKDHTLVKTELFVPILVVLGYKELEDALSQMNDVDYGLTGGIFSNDRKEIELFFKRAKAGVLYANRVSGSTTGAMVGVQPFVGWKKSGSSGKGAGGPYYLQQFLREQSQTFYE